CGQWGRSRDSPPAIPRRERHTEVSLARRAWEGATRKGAGETPHSVLVGSPPIRAGSKHSIGEIARRRRTGLRAGGTFIRRDIPGGEGVSFTIPKISRE